MTGRKKPLSSVTTILEDSKFHIGVNTWFPLVSLPLIVGVIAWLTTMFSYTQQNAEAISMIRKEVSAINDSRDGYRKHMWDSIRDQDKRLARMEGKIDALLNHHEKKGQR